MRTIELNAVRMGILDIAVGFDEKFRNTVLFDKICPTSSCTKKNKLAIYNCKIYGFYVIIIPKLRMFRLKLYLIIL